MTNHPTATPKCAECGFDLGSDPIGCEVCWTHSMDTGSTFARLSRAERARYDAEEAADARYDQMRDDRLTGDDR